MIYLVVIVIALLIGGVIWFVRDLKKGAQGVAPSATTSVPYKVEPTVIPSITVADKPVDAVIPVTSQVASTLAYYNPNRVVVDGKGAPNDWDGRSLKYDGAGPHLPEGSDSLSIPGLPAGKMVLAIADVYGPPVSFIVRKVGGNPVYTSATPVANEFPIQIVEPGDYTLEKSGGQCVVKVMSRGQ